MKDRWSVTGKGGREWADLVPLTMFVVEAVKKEIQRRRNDLYPTTVPLTRPILCYLAKAMFLINILIFNVTVR